MQPSWTESFKAFSRSLMAESRCPGLAVGIGQHGAPIYMEGFGFRDREQGLPMTPETVQGIGSCTKTFTAVAIMQLQEHGLLRVEDPVVQYLPQFRSSVAVYTSQITIHHLLSNTAGLPPLPTMLRCLARTLRFETAEVPGLDQVTPIDTPAELICYLSETEYEPYPPGACFSYSNDGFGLLGAVIERITGQSYTDYVTEHILRPAGMSSSTFANPVQAGYPEVTTLYAADWEPVEPAPHWWDAGAFIPFGFLRSNIPDMLWFAELFATCGRVGDVQILRPESVAAITTPHAVISHGWYYGYGAVVTPDFHGATLVEHSGGTKGIGAWYMAVPEHGLTGVALANLAEAPSGKGLLGAINSVLGLPLTEPRVTHPTRSVEAEALAQYAGTYRSDYWEYTVTVNDGRVFLTDPGKRICSHGN